ncbi:Bacteriophytochrome protein [Gluconobacter thailandicus F149-1 = NBRC 100600]|uniref:PAS fold-2 domain-containing protein n=1 Tax=Gluconobacter thailandicus NBRC 3257 TaxID=1381097 RepID=A0ABQ0IXN0_GLUTH|nr:hypothetical protein [Gluconobacter thailandicus]GAD26961.1 hypothetical protein NBRC3257_1960 [Gluconobacter thailandicus NBRC 3257]GAN93488.1 Bacteriophytochrome protein [Gluconobacter thailandicus F149-1 = NBRC 100600]GBR57818.1 hypothetical protein AA100600_0453 [Gluconobacter thailandicus F149-1 = NBRC 100600]GEL85692.1 hypothetical protein GTH01_00500 [Gluconobacter thailandicus F149-1 = NBRC 100600]
MTSSSKNSQLGQPFAEALLTACDREPIHRPDAIQPYGLLLIADASTLTVLGGAGDLETRLSAEWLGCSLNDLLGLTAERFHNFTPASFSDARISGLQDETFSILVHASDGKLLVELEPIQEARLLTWEIFGRIDATADRFERCPDVAEVCRQRGKSLQQTDWL